MGGKLKCAFPKVYNFMLWFSNLTLWMSQPNLSTWHFCVQKDERLRFTGTENYYHL